MKTQKYLVHQGLLASPVSIYTQYTRYYYKNQPQIMKKLILVLVT